MESDSGHSEIDFIEVEAAQRFFAVNHPRGSLDSKGSGVAVGILKDGELIGAARFISPRSTAMAAVYSVELLQVLASQDDELKSSAERMISFFRDRRSPSDFFAETEEVEGISGLAGMTPTPAHGPSSSSILEWINPCRSFYVYKLTADGSDRYYYGVRQLKRDGATADDCLVDHYWGSGTGEHFKRWRDSHLSAGSLRKEVLAIFSRKLEAYGFEAETIGGLWKTDPNCLNSCPGGLAGGILNQAAGVLGYELLTCELCGKEAQHQNGNCLSCRVNLGKSLAHCNSCEAETLHRAGLCYRCIARRNYSERYCESCQAITVHRKDSCCTCQNRASVTIRWCDSCQVETKHQGTTCNTCNAKKSVSLKTCQIHGETKHQGDVCNRCNAESSVRDQWCENCAATTKHQSGKCYNCKNRDAVSEKYCTVCEAITKHSGESCYKCRLKAKELFCSNCDRITQHNGSQCVACRPSFITIRYCESCQDETKHRGKNCTTCKTRALTYFCEECNRDTKHKLNGICTLCERREGRKRAKAQISDSMTK